MSNHNEQGSTTTSRPAGVVVGDDGTRYGHCVVDRAQDEADRLDLPLTLLTVVRAVSDPDLSVSAQLRAEHAATGQARRRLDASLARTRARRPGRTVTGLLLVDPSEATLAGSLSACALLVIGSRGPAGHRVFSMGTTSRRLLHAARCPLLVVPVDSVAGPGRRSGLVVAGVDDSALGPGVLRAAAAASPTRRVQLLHSYHPRRGETSEQALARARATCDEQVRRAALDARVHVTRVLTHEPPAAALVRQTGGASLVVVGTRGPLALAGLAHDSVSSAVVSAMPCPVLVVPRPAPPQPVAGTPQVVAGTRRAQMAGR